LCYWPLRITKAVPARGCRVRVGPPIGAGGLQRADRRM
jgi:hypothetical protein